MPQVSASVAFESVGALHAALEWLCSEACSEHFEVLNAADQLTRLWDVEFTAGQRWSDGLH